MPNIVEITDLSAPELDVYARLTQAQLRNRLEPEKGDVYKRQAAGKLKLTEMRNTHGNGTARTQHGILSSSGTV